MTIDHYPNSSLLGLDYKLAKKFMKKTIGFFRFQVNKTLEELAQIVMDLDITTEPEEAKKFVQKMNGNGFQYNSSGSGFVVERAPKKIHETYSLTKANCYGGSIF